MKLIITFPNFKLYYKTIINYYNQTFSKEDIQKVNKYIKRCPASLIIRIIEIKTSMTYHRVPVKLTTITKTINSNSWRACAERGTIVQLVAM